MILEKREKNSDGKGEKRVHCTLKRAVIINGVRTPVGRYMGALKGVPAYDLGALVLNEAAKRAEVDTAQMEEVVWGQSYRSGEYVNSTHMSLLNAGWPSSIPGITLHRRRCGGKGGSRPGVRSQRCGKINDEIDSLHYHPRSIF
jgi:acetyl-CoA C-acetyltransferase